MKNVQNQIISANTREIDNSIVKILNMDLPRKKFISLGETRFWSTIILFLCIGCSLKLVNSSI